MKKTWISSAHQGFVKENMVSNTLSAYLLAARKGADMIETDARMSKDGVLMVNHDPDIRGYDAKGNQVRYLIAETDSKLLRETVLAPHDPMGIQYVPTLEQALHLAYFTGMKINIDMKEGIAHAEEIARLVAASGMRGRTVYATNGAGEDAIRLVRRYDPGAFFIDTVGNFTAEALASVTEYPRYCFAYTGDFSEENIARVRKSGCMLATISLNAENAPAAFRYHPDMAEYPHTSDFAGIDRSILDGTSFF